MSWRQQADEAFRMEAACEFTAFKLKLSDENELEPNTSKTFKLKINSNALPVSGFGSNVYAAWKVHSHRASDDSDRVCGLCLALF